MFRSIDTSQKFTLASALTQELFEVEVVIANVTNHFRQKLIEGVQNNNLVLVNEAFANRAVDPSILIPSKEDGRLVKLAVYAAECGYWQIVEELSKLRKETRKNEFGYANALCYAVNDQQWEAAKSLVMGGADLSLRIDNKTIAMRIHTKELTSKDAYWSFIDWLATHTKSPGKDEYEYGSTLLDAVILNRKKTVRLLLKAGAHCAWYSKKTKQFPAHIAVAANDIEMLNIIIPYMQPFDSEHQDDKQQTPLALACALQHWDCALALVTAPKFELPYTASNSDTIIKMLQAKQTQLAITTLRKTANDSTPQADYPLLHWAVASHWVRVVEYILDNHLGSQVSLSKNGLTPIELACKKGFISTAVLLIQKANNPQFNLLVARQMHYDEALLHVIQCSSRELAKLLFQHGASCRRWNSEIGNIFLFAAMQKKDLPMVMLLIENGADPYRQNKHGKNSIEIARSKISVRLADQIEAYMTQRNSKHSFYAPLNCSIMADELLDHSIEALQQQANFHRKNLYDQAVEFSKSYDVLQQVAKCQRAILVHHLDEMCVQRTSMEQRIQANLKEGPIANLPLEVEIQHCSDLIRHINLLLANPNELMPVDRLRHHPFAAGKDIVAYVHAVAAVNTFEQIINQRLTDLVATINETRFSSTHVTRTLWLPGKPEPIKNLLTLCAKRTHVSSIEITFAIYCDVLNALAFGCKQDKQHPDTTQFLQRYYQFFSKIDFSFCKEQTQPGAPTVTPLSYEEITKQIDNQLTQFIK